MILMTKHAPCAMNDLGELECKKCNTIVHDVATVYDILDMMVDPQDLFKVPQIIEVLTVIPGEYGLKQVNCNENVEGIVRSISSDA